MNNATSDRYGGLNRSANLTFAELPEEAAFRRSYTLYDLGELQALLDPELSGHVDSIAGATGAKLSLLPPENATGNFVKIVQRVPVKVAIDHAPEGFVLRPGMNVDVTIFTK